MNSKDEKSRIRRRAASARRSQADKDVSSVQIFARLRSLSQWESASCVLVYVDVRDEVRTRHALPWMLDSGKRIVVPYCVDERLQLFHLTSLDELEGGAFSVPEPKQGLRELQQRAVAADAIDLALVPGVAFDRRGGRAGQGLGYFDRLLAQTSDHATLVGLAFESQLVERAPMLAHDVRMDLVITESNAYRRENEVQPG